MTAVNMIVQPKDRAGFIITDCAYTDRAGRIDAIGCKFVGTMNRLPWAFGITGNVKADDLAHALKQSNPTTMKQLIRRLPDALRYAVARIDATSEDRGVGVLRGVVWDYAAKLPHGFMIHSDPEVCGMPGTEPFSWYKSSWALTLNDGQVTPADVLGRDVELTDPDSFDVAVDSIVLVARQRANPCNVTTPGLDPTVRHRIGGGVDVIGVTKLGVQAYRVHTWQEDRVGEFINP